MKISVAIAAYNGEKYIKEQIYSILPQLNINDEIIVSLDPSTDETEKILKDIKSQDDRLKIVYGQGKGVVINFENAIKNTTGDLIFLSDQDDVWVSDKIKKVVENFDEDTFLLLHDAFITDEKLNVVNNSFFSLRNTNINFSKNIIKNSFMGCCMVFKRELLDYILPFPYKIPMHDQWIGLIALKFFKAKKLDMPLIYYRRHDNNASQLNHSKIIKMITWRITLIINLSKRYFSLKSRRN